MRSLNNNLSWPVYPAPLPCLIGLPTLFIMNNLELLQLIDQLANLLRAEERKDGAAEGLMPVHIQVLDYLARCNRFSNTPHAISYYLGASKGTTSQSIQLLYKKGYLSKRADSEDKRITRLFLSEQGRVFIKDHPLLKVWNRVCNNQPDAQLLQFQQTLIALMRGLQHANGNRSFGICRSCRHFKKHPQSFYCGLTHKLLGDADSTKICLEHQDKD